MGCQAPSHLSACCGRTCGWCKDWDRNKPAPSAEPQMPEGWEFIDGEFGGTFLNEGLCKVMSMGRIRQLLATQGLAIVPASDVPTQAETLLERAEKLLRQPRAVARAKLADEIAAELARRAAKGEKT